MALANLKQNNKAHITAWDSVRTNGITREPAIAEESVTSPKSSKGPSGDGACPTGVGAWGRWMAPRGL